MRKAALLFGFLLPAVALAQQSASFKIEEHTFNAGGHPRGGTVVSSASYQMTLVAIGESATLLELTSAGFSMTPGFAGLNPPPGEIANLRFDDETSLVWDLERSVGAYNLYQGSITDPFDPGYGTCAAAGIATESATITATPPAGEALFILVTAENRLNEEGTKGSNSDGLERDNSNACP